MMRAHPRPPFRTLDVFARMIAGPAATKRHLQVMAVFVAGLFLVGLAITTRDGHLYSQAEREFEHSLTPDQLAAFRRGASPADVALPQREEYVRKTQEHGLRSRAAHVDLLSKIGISMVCSVPFL